MAVINPFTNIEDKQLESNSQWGVDNLDNVGSISAGGGTASFKFDQASGLWLGAERFIDAPFKVDMSGNTTLNSGDFSGNITIVGADGKGIFFKDVASGGIQGTLTFNSTYGTTFTTAPGKNFYMNPDGSFVVIANTLDIDMLGYRHAYLNAGTGNLTLTAIAGPALMEGYTTATVKSDTGAALVDGATSARLQAGTGIASVKSTSSYVELVSQTSGQKILLNSSGNIDLNVNYPTYEVTTNSDHIYFRNGKILTVKADAKFDGSFEVPASGYTYYINGVGKTAIVPTSEGYKALYTNESPNVWFNDFAKIIYPKWYEFWKKPIVIADKIFLEVTTAPYHFIPTMNKNILQIWGIRKGYEEVRFTSKTKEEFEKNNKFWSTPQI